MKQQITKEQWNELSNKEREYLEDNFVMDFTELLTIGQMIEFLGEDLAHINHYVNTKLFCVAFLRIKGGEIISHKWFENKELVSALWEAVKYKIKNPT